MRLRQQIVLALATTAFVGCGLPVVQHHTDPTPGCHPEDEECSRAFIEERDEYLLGFVEFDDLGWAHDRRQQAALVERIEREIEQRDVLMLVFAHGWKHDSRTCDSNVTCFRTILRQLYETEQALAPKGEARRIIGIYVGWRGTSWDNRLLKQLTFYGRKATAQKVGSGAVTELLVRLKQLRQQRRDLVSGPSTTRLVIVGHSFGGALIFSATSQLIMERMAIADLSADDRRVDGFGDLVVLVNPAFEAARYQPIHAALEDGDFVADQNPIFVVVTSRGDTATKNLFPRGRAISIQFDDYPQGERGRFQKRASKHAVGHFDEFRTHSLETYDTPEPDPQDKSKVALCQCPFLLTGEPTPPDLVSDNAAALRSHDWRSDPEFTFPSSKLVWDDLLPPNAPVMVISVHPSIVPNHVDIYQPAFVDFLRHLIIAAGEEQVYR